MTSVTDAFIRHLYYFIIGVVVNNMSGPNVFSVRCLLDRPFDLFDTWSVRHAVRADRKNSLEAIGMCSS
jgi:hypothetical protein